MRAEALCERLRIVEAPSGKEAALSSSGAEAGWSRGCPGQVGLGPPPGWALSAGSRRLLPPEGRPGRMGRESAAGGAGARRRAGANGRRPAASEAGSGGARGQQETAAGVRAGPERGGRRRARRGQ